MQSFKTESRNDVNIVVTNGIVSCHKDKLCSGASSVHKMSPSIFSECDQTALAISLNFCFA